MRRFRYHRGFGRNHGQNKIKRLALAVTAALLCWALVSEAGLSSVSDELITEAVKAEIQSCINTALNEELSKADSEFVTVSRDDSGKVSSVIANTAQLNSLKHGVLSQLEKQLNGNVTARVPLGSLTGVRVLNGRGPCVSIKLKLETSVSVSFNAELISAGVNQSCHKITASVAAESFSQSKRFSVAVSATATAVLAEAVIVGEVPSFTVS